MTPDDPATAPDTSPAAGALRCSDADRERISAVIHRAAGDGRLTIEEAEERLGRVYLARYGHELDALTADLPAAEVRPAGWLLVGSMARDQLVGDVAVMVGRRAGPPGQRLRTLVIAVVALLLVMGAIALLLHGVIADGPEYGPESH